MLVIGNEARPVLVFVPVTAFADEGFVSQPLAHDHMGHGGQHGNIGARLQRQVMRGLDMG